MKPTFFKVYGRVDPKLQEQRFQAEEALLAAIFGTDTRSRNQKCSTETTVDKLLEYEEPSGCPMENQAVKIFEKMTNRGQPMTEIIKFLKTIALYKYLPATMRKETEDTPW
jgi:hypothetical protein